MYVYIGDAKSWRQMSQDIGKRFHTPRRPTDARHRELFFSCWNFLANAMFFISWLSRRCSFRSRLARFFSWRFPFCFAYCFFFVACFFLHDIYLLIGKKVTQLCQPDYFSVPVHTKQKFLHPANMFFQLLALFTIGHAYVAQTFCTVLFS